MNQLHNLQFDTTRGKVITTRGVELDIKLHRQWKYVNYDGKKIGLSSIPVKRQNGNDYVFNYVFLGGFVGHPCPAMDYWIYRHRLGNRISPNDYKIKFKIKLK